MPTWAGADECLSHELMHPLLLLVRIWPLVTESFNGGPARSFRVAINVSTSAICEACGHAGPDKFEPVIFRMRWPWCNGHASWLARLCIVHTPSVPDWPSRLLARDTGQSEHVAESVTRPSKAVAAPVR